MDLKDVKTALLKQVAVLLEDYGYKVIYVNPTENVVEKAVQVSYDIKDVVEVLEELLSMYLGNFAKAVAHLGFAAVSRIAKKISKPKIAVLIDDVFQAIGLEKSTIASYIKSALNLIEYPEASYENIVVVIATSEGISRNEIGRHTWSYIYAMWNMPKDGFEHLYDQIPGEKPCFEDVWRATGGNPRILGVLYENEWDVDTVVDMIIRSKNLPRFVAELSENEKVVLVEALDDVDHLWGELRKYRHLVDRLIELNLIVAPLYDGDPKAWIDTPPEKDEELGIGTYVAWQTPLHREAVKKL